MKAIKGCVNRDCKSFKKRIHYKESFEYCPQCSEKLEYVCSDCWKVLEQNNSRLCIACKTKRGQKRAQQMNNAKVAGAAVIGVAKVTWDKKDKIADFAKASIKVVKK